MHHRTAGADAAHARAVDDLRSAVDECTPEEIITVSEIVGSECMKRAEAQFSEMEQSAGEQSDRLEPNGPTDPSQVN